MILWKRRSNKLGACRETANIWFYMKKRWWRKLFKSFKNPYFLHDSFGVYLNRWILCPFLGHRNMYNVNDIGEPERLYCFNCDREIKNED